MSISLAGVSDIQEIEKLVNSAYRGDSSRKGWTTEADLLGGIRIDEEALKELMQSQNSEIYIHKQDSRITGCVNLILKREVIYLGMLTVDPMLQNSGIGKQILQYVEGLAKKRSFKEIEMTVISKRTELIAWYERHGFKKTEEKRPFPMNNPKFGLPKTDLEFIVLRKLIS